jgi:serine/threonine-protein kinase
MYEDLKTCMNEEKKKEGKCVYKFPEEDLSETRILTDVKKAINKDQPIITPIEKDEFKPKTKMTKILIAFVSLFIVGMFFLFFMLPKMTKIPDIKVPDVSTLTVQKAEEKLKSVGFEVALETNKVYSDTIEEGYVVKTSPASGRTIKKGSTITIYESLGTQKITIEDYTGENIYEVKAILEIQGIRVDIESKDVDNIEEYEDKEDYIIDQSIKSGDLVKGSQIILYYPNIVVYPDMIGWTIDEVQEFKEKYDLILTILEEETDEYEEGYVMSQSRRAGTLVVRKADFAVTVAIPVVIEEIEETE